VTGRKANPKDARAGNSDSGGKQGGVSSATQSNRKTGDRCGNAVRLARARGALGSC
jgi:hypothetical protein